MHPARWWRPLEGRVLCALCPRHCRLADGQAGFCMVRKNEGGKLWSLSYGNTTGLAFDPVEKKPLYHFLPGTRILSLGGIGCNLGCRFCQNWHISKARSETSPASPAQIAGHAVGSDCPSVALTYNDPIISAEYAIDIARECRQRGVHAVLVTAGYVTAEARPELFQHISAANVDLKSMSEDFYRRYTASHLGPVLETLVWLCKHTSVCVELTNLVIPGLNDDDVAIRRLAEWVGTELGDDVPVHFSAFHPAFRMLDRPRTPPQTLTRARQLATEIGLKYVYTGNVHDPSGQTTCCPRCGRAVIVREGYFVKRVALAKGTCSYCGASIAGIFDELPLLSSTGFTKS